MPALRATLEAQVSPGVYLRAMQAALGTSNIPLSEHECCVSLLGGTPEAVTAAVVLGFRNVIYVAGDEEEQLMMQLPTLAEERESRVDFASCLASGNP